MTNYYGIVQTKSMNKSFKFSWSLNNSGTASASYFNDGIIIIQNKFLNEC